MTFLQKRSEDFRSLVTGRSKNETFPQGFSMKNKSMEHPRRRDIHYCPFPKKKKGDQTEMINIIRDVFQRSYFVSILQVFSGFS